MLRRKGKIMKEKCLKRLKRFFDLLKYYFNKNERNKIKFKTKLSDYQKLDKIDLEFEIEKSKSKVNWHEDIYKIITAVIKGLVGVAFLGIVVRVSYMFLPKSVQLNSLNEKQVQFAMFIAIIFSLIVFVSCFVGLIGYRKYINDIKSELTLIEKLLIQKRGICRER
jgi:hypothetical protein